MDMVGRKRSRYEAFEADADQLQAAILQGLLQDGDLEHVAEAVFQKAINTPVFKQELAVEHAWTKEHQQQLASGLRSTLQALTNQAVSAEQRLMSYTPDGHQQPAVSMLLKAAIGLAQKVRIGKDHAFQLFEDIVETGDIEEVKTAFKLVYKHWDVSEHWENPLAMQRACNMFVKRLSNDQDAEFLGTVLTLVAKILPFNAKAGLNLVWLVNQHPIHIDEHVQASVDGRDPVDEKLYKQLWELQDAFQDPSNQLEPNKFGETTFKIKTVLSKLQQENIGVASTTTAVPQENGQSIIVKYLTSSKLTTLQLRDAAFRRTLLVQCLVLLHACQHPRQFVNKPPIELRDVQKKQLRELQQLLYEELSRTPEQGQAFTDVVRTVMDRETAFVSWKSEGAPEYWQKTEPGLPTVSDSELNRPLPEQVPKKQKVAAPLEDFMDIDDSAKPDTDVSRMWDNSGSKHDLYRDRRDPVLLPRMGPFFARIGQEITPDNIRQRNKYATAQAPLQRDAAGTEHNGPDPLFTFRCQRMLQRTDMALWEQTNQLDQPGERLEAAFAMLFPSLVPQGWEKPVLAEKTPVQKPAQSAIKGRAVKGTATPASSGPKDTEPGEKQVADAMTPADSVASPDALNGVVLTDSKPQKQVEASASDQPTEDVVMGEAQKPELDTAAAAAPAGVKQEDAPARIPDTTSTPAADGVDTTEPLQQQNGQLSPSANDAPVVTAKQLHADAPAEPAEEAGANDAQ